MNETINSQNQRLQQAQENLTDVSREVNRVGWEIEAYGRNISARNFYLGALGLRRKTTGYDVMRDEANAMNEQFDKDRAVDKLMPEPIDVDSKTKEINSIKDPKDRIVAFATLGINYATDSFRKQNVYKWKQEANKQNRFRKLRKDKKVTAEDVMRDEANAMNEQFDKDRSKE